MRHLMTYTMVSLREGLGRTGESAVDDNDLTGDKAMAVDQAQHGLSDIVGGAAALERRIAGAAGHQSLVVLGEGSLHPITFHPPGGNGIDANLRPEGVGEGLRQVGDRGLASCVGKRLRAGAQAGDAAGVDDAAVRRFSEQRHGGPSDEKKSEDVDGKDAVPVLDLHSIQVLGLYIDGRARVVDQHIQAPEFPFGRFEHGPHACVIAHIAAIHQRSRAGGFGLARGGPGRFLATAEIDDHVVAIPGHRQCRTAPNACGRPRNQGYWSLATHPGHPNL